MKDLENVEIDKKTLYKNLKNEDVIEEEFLKIPYDTEELYLAYINYHWG